MAHVITEHEFLSSQDSPTNCGLYVCCHEWDRLHMVNKHDIKHYSNKIIIIVVVVVVVVDHLRSRCRHSRHRRRRSAVMARHL